MSTKEDLLRTVQTLEQAFKQRPDLLCLDVAAKNLKQYTESLPNVTILNVTNKLAEGIRRKLTTS